jgi:hypothetical protein
LTGQDLVNVVNHRLMGYQGVTTNLVILEYLQEAAAEVWVVLKALEQDYFGQVSQFSNPNGPHFFPPVNVNERVYQLPKDFRSMRFIEVLTAGYEQILFKYYDINSAEFQTARRAANVDRSLQPTVEYWYTVFGNNKFIMAQFPEAFMLLRLYYVRNLLPLVGFTDGTFTVANDSTAVQFNATSYSWENIQTMIGAQLYSGNALVGAISAVNPAAQSVTLAAPAPAAYTTAKYVVTQSIDELIDPYTLKIADFALQKIMLSAQDQAQWTAWKDAWSKDILSLYTSASPRNDADPVYVQDFTG